METLPIQNILVVDDEESYRNLLGQYLQIEGYACHTAEDAFDAADKIQSTSCELVISDIAMEKKDGLQLMRETRAKWPHVSFIIMTGFSEYSYSEIIEQGAADFIKKPFDLGELKAKIERIARERGHLANIKNLGKAFEKEALLNKSIAELSRTLLTSRSIHEISDLVLEHARMLTNSSTGFIGYIEPHNGYLVCLSLSDDAQKHCQVKEDAVFESFNGLWGWVLTQKKSLFSNSIPDDPRSSGFPSGHIPVQRFLAAPALAGDTLVGQVALANADHEYCSEDLSIVERIANVYALAIKRKLLEDELNITVSALHEEVQRRMQVEIELKAAQNQLKALLDERTAKLQKAGEVMKSSIERFRKITQQS